MDTSVIFFFLNGVCFCIVMQVLYDAYKYRKKTKTFKKYADIAITTAMYKDIGKTLVYPALGLTGEAGEVAEKVKKLIRDNNGIITDEFREDMKRELGDVLWYINALAHELRLELDEIASVNLEKLLSRKKRCKIQGSGDDR